MNILILSDIEASGEWVATQNMVEEILKKDKKIKFYLIAYGKENFLFNKKLFKKIILLDRLKFNFPLQHYRGTLFDLFKAIRIIFKFNKQFEFHKIICTEYILLIASRIVFIKRTIIYWLHGYRYHFMPKLTLFTSYLYFRKFLERFAFIVSNKIIIPSVYAKNILKQELGLFYHFKTLIVSPNIITGDFDKRYSDFQLNTFKKKLKIPENKKIVLYVGRLDNYKNILSLTKAFYLTINAIDNLILLIAYSSFYTDIDYLRKIQAFIKNNKIQEKVIFVKDLHRKKMPKIYQISDCAVLPSSIEMGSLFLLEALHSCLPTFSTNVGGAKDLLAKKIDPLFVLKDASEKSIQLALQDFFLKSPGWYTKIKKRINDVAEKELSTKTSVKNFQKLLY